MQLKLEKKQAELHRAHSDNNSKDQTLRTRDQMIESLQRQITQLKDDIRVKEVEIDSIQKRRAEDDRDREFMNREERSRAQKELDKCEKQIRELQTQKQIEYNTAQTKLENLQHENSQLQAECKASQMQLAETKVTNANL